MKQITPPQLIILAGPNGAGKSTFAAGLLEPTFPFINADEIAKTLAPSSGRNIQAGRLMLEQLDALEQERASSALETTLSGYGYVERIKRLRTIGYQVALYFLWLPTVELAIARVAERVRLGGHNIPEETIRRRYLAGYNNFTKHYKPLCDTWRYYDNALLGRPILLAAKEFDGEEQWFIDPKRTIGLDNPILL